VDKANTVLRIDLFDVRIEIPDPEAPQDSTKTRYINAKKYPVRLDFSDLSGKREIKKKHKNMTFFELIFRIRNPRVDREWMSERDLKVDRGRDLIELHQRICLGISPLMFVLVAIPLGITSHRKESSIGMLMSLGIMFVYYLFIILSDTLEKSPEIYPWLLPWVPIVLGQIGGLVMLRRAD